MGTIKKYKNINKHADIYIASDLAKIYSFFASSSCTAYMVKHVRLLNYDNRKKLWEIMC